jgi:hypothetical protein
MACVCVCGYISNESERKSKISTQKNNFEMNARKIFKKNLAIFSGVGGNKRKPQKV